MKRGKKSTLPRTASPLAPSAAGRARTKSAKGKSRRRTEAGTGRAGKARSAMMPSRASKPAASSAAVSGSPKARIAIEKRDPAWSAVAPGISAVARKAVLAALAAALPPGPRAEIALALGDDALLHRLNRDYRARDKPTNVLSFPYVASPGVPAENGRFLGDVAIARETLLAEAAAEGKPAANHLSHLIVHGVLHLLGYDHEHAADARRMEALEREILAGLGIPDPYRVRSPASRRR
jgi:probable rRNA maturation factor